MRNVRLLGFVTASAVALGAWTGTAGASVETTSTDQRTISVESDLDPAVVSYIVGELREERSVTVRITPGGDVSAPSLTGGIIGPPPPPPIVRDVLRRVAYTAGIEGEVEITVGRDGGEVSAPSLTGGIIGPPPPPPIVHDLLERIRGELSKDILRSVPVIELRTPAGERVVYRAASL